MFTEKTGCLVNLKVIGDDEDVMIISGSGTVIRLHASDISLIGRNTQGVRIMRLKDAVVATVAVVPGEEAEGDAPAAQDAPADAENGPAEEATAGEGAPEDEE